MNAATFARDHFLQAVWVGLWPAFTIGIVFDLSPLEGGVAGLISGLALTLLSMFYHSAIRVQLPWLDRVIVTPQVHRIHHSVDPAHHNCNFADALPIFPSSTSSLEPIVVPNVTSSPIPDWARRIRHPRRYGERSSSRSRP
jgi:sterol desaturase/sphingolipid hydroxylase (fatty acid hydroxylase superfamily)